MSTPRLYRVILPVTNIDTAAQFYARVFKVKGERVSPGRHYFDCGGVILACYDPIADDDPIGEGWKYHENQYIYFSVSDLDVVYQRVTKAGGHNLTKIEDMPWGERLFYALDPLSNPISFVDQNTIFTGSKTDGRTE